MGALDWAGLVEKRNAWVAHNFPDQAKTRTPLDSVLGCFEEVGELTHAHLKQAQSIRGSDDEHVSNAQDAIGDLTVYLLGVMNYAQFVPVDSYVPVMAPEPTPWPHSDNMLLKLEGATGSLARHLLHSRSYIDSDTGLRFIINQIVYYARQYCVARGWDYEQIVADTWNSVSKRDWIKYPGTGLPEPVEA